MLTVVVMLFGLAACDDDDKSAGNVDLASLTQLITEANDLIANSEEGTTPGKFKPGSKKNYRMF